MDGLFFTQRWAIWWARYFSGLWGSFDSACGGWAKEMASGLHERWLDDMMLFWGSIFVNIHTGACCSLPCNYHYIYFCLGYVVCVIGCIMILYIKILKILVRYLIERINFLSRWLRYDYYPYFWIRCSLKALHWHCFDTSMGISFLVFTSSIYKRFFNWILNMRFLTQTTLHSSYS
jgi:hypothetical protein